MEFVDRTLARVDAKSGDLVLVLAGDAPRVYEQMGALRLHMADELGLVTRTTDGPWDFLWVTDFPLVEWDPESKRYVAVHHPFTSPHIEDIPRMLDDPAATRARAYDLVLNGTEIGGGSIRIHEGEVQRKLFKLLGIDEEEAQHRFGFLLDAFRYGAPPHGGIAFGFDRLIMLLAAAQSLREVIAFPKTQRAQELMVDSPDSVDDHQLEDLHIRVVPPKEA